MPQAQTSPAVRPDPLPSDAGNMFCPEHVGRSLAAVRQQIEFAVLVSHGRRRCVGSVPDVVQLRNREVELIVRLDMLGQVSR